ncbi:MAG: DUF2339 domain-containing protein [Elusimicrobia bacterium]|nr:DUF2339 domain-containing protein [Elusimicrobiota bacterium]
MDQSESAGLRTEIRALAERVAALERLQSVPPPPLLQPPPPPRPRAAAGDSENRQAGNALGVVAAVCFVLAASFLIKLAVDSGWLTPARQLGLAALLGASLIAAGLALPRREDGYTGLLPASGIVILYLAAYGGNLYYGFYGPWLAAAAASAVSALALFLLSRFRSEVILAVAVIGTYACPLLLPALKGASFESMVFFAVWDAAFVLWAAWNNERSLPLMACYMALGVFAASSPTVYWNAPQADLGKAALFQFMQFAVFLGGVGYSSIHNRKPLSPREAWSFFPALLFFYATEYSLIARISSQWAPWAALAFAGLVYGVYLVAHESLERESLESAPMVNAFVAVVLLHAFYLELLPERWAPWFAVLLLAAAPALRRPAGSGALWPFGAAALVVIGMNYLTLFFGRGGRGPWEAGFLNVAFSGLMVFGALALPASEERRSGRDLWFCALLAAAAQGMMGLHRLAHLAGPEGYERFLATLLWALFALGLLGLAEARRDPLVAKSAVFVLGITAGKGLLFDVAANQPVVRIVCLLVLGSALYLGGLLLRRAAAWDKTEAHS